MRCEACEAIPVVLGRERSIVSFMSSFRANSFSIVGAENPDRIDTKLYGNIILFISQ